MSFAESSNPYSALESAVTVTGFLGWITYRVYSERHILILSQSTDRPRLLVILISLLLASLLWVISNGFWAAVKYNPGKFGLVIAPGPQKYRLYVDAITDSASISYSNALWSWPASDLNGNASTIFFADWLAAMNLGWTLSCLFFIIGWMSRSAVTIRSLCQQSISLQNESSSIRTAAAMADVYSVFATLLWVSVTVLAWIMSPHTIPFLISVADPNQNLLENFVQANRHVWFRHMILRGGFVVFMVIAILCLFRLSENFVRTRQNFMETVTGESLDGQQWRPSRLLASLTLTIRVVMILLSISTLSLALLTGQIFNFFLNPVDASSLEGNPIGWQLQIVEFLIKIFDFGVTLLYPLLVEFLIKLAYLREEDNWIRDSGGLSSLANWNMWTPDKRTDDSNRDTMIVVEEDDRLYDVPEETEGGLDNLTKPTQYHDDDAISYRLAPLVPPRSGDRPSDGTPLANLSSYWSIMTRNMPINSNQPRAASPPSASGTRLVLYGDQCYDWAEEQRGQMRSPSRPRSPPAVYRGDYIGIEPMMDRGPQQNGWPGHPPSNHPMDNSPPRDHSPARPWISPGSTL